MKPRSSRCWLGETVEGPGVAAVFVVEFTRWGMARVEYRWTDRYDPLDGSLTLWLAFRRCRSRVISSFLKTRSWYTAEAARDGIEMAVLDQEDPAVPKSRSPCPCEMVRAVCVRGGEGKKAGNAKTKPAGSPRLYQSAHRKTDEKC